MKPTRKTQASIFGPPHCQPAALVVGGFEVPEVGVMIGKEAVVWYREQGNYSKRYKNDQSGNKRERGDWPRVPRQPPIPSPRFHLFVSTTIDTLPASRPDFKLRHYRPVVASSSQSSLRDE
jgi:hypothetical protein